MPELRLIDDQVFAIAQDRFERNKRLGKRNRKYDYLLAGHIKCHCGYAMSGVHTAGRGEKVYLYYHCNESNRSVRANKLCREKVIQAELSDVLVSTTRKGFG